jgi:hypothetical protein
VGVRQWAVEKERESGHRVIGPSSHRKTESIEARARTAPHILTTAARTFGPPNNRTPNVRPTETAPAEGAAGWTCV